MLELDRNKQKNQYERFLVFTISFFRYPEYTVHWFLILDVFWGEYLFVCFLWITGVSVVWILQLVLLNDVTTLLESENGIQTQYSRGETTSGYGSHSYWSKLRWDPTPPTPSFWPPPSLSHVSKHSSHFIQRKLNLFKELKT